MKMVEMEAIEAVNSNESSPSEVLIEGRAFESCRSFSCKGWNDKNFQILMVQLIESRILG